MLEILREAVRSVVRFRRNALSVIGCVAAGLAAACSVGALLELTLVRSVPFPDADRLVRVWVNEEGHDPRLDLTVPELSLVMREARTLDRVAGSARVRAIGVFPGGAERMRGEAVTESYFETLGLRPALGRAFGPEDADTPVVVLSHTTWMSKFGGDPAVLGQPLRTSRGPRTVIGVMPEWFHGAIENDEVELWIPLAQLEPREALTDTRSRRCWVIARRAPGVSEEAVQAELSGLTPALREAASDVTPRHSLRVEPMGENWRREFRSAGGILALASGALLLIAIGNAAALLLVRARERGYDLAIRASLGASHHRLALVVMTESMLLVTAGGALGVALSYPLLRGFLALAPLPLPKYVEIAPAIGPLLLAALGVLFVSALAGGVPAWRVLRVDPAQVLNRGGRSQIASATSGVRLFLAAQLAGALVLASAGTILVRSYDLLGSTSLGFDRHGVQALAVTFSAADSGPSGDTSQKMRAIVERFRAHPDVAAVGVVAPTMPAWNAWKPHALGLPGLNEDGLRVGAHEVGDGLFGLLDIRIVAGRLPTAADLAGGRAAVISRALAERAGGETAVLGRTISLVDRPGETPRVFDIVGVVTDVAWDGFAEQDTGRRLSLRPGDGASHLDVYVPLDLAHVRVVSFGVRTRTGELGGLLDRLRKDVAAVAPTSAVHWTTSLADSVADEYQGSRFHTLLVTSFAAAALALAASGLYAFVSAAVFARAREIALRRAIGAQARHVLALVSREALGVVVPALFVGALGVFALPPLLSRFVFGVSPLDPALLAAAATVFLAVGLLAVASPAWRALRVDPGGALRSE
ncbi:MAG: ABC transporter permease [Acidobacteria bacterium]|nr:ABC transporter permease [Acidobacteriota bacterium]